MLSEKLNSHRRKRSKTALKSTKNNFVRKNAKNRGFSNALINSRLRNNAFRCPVTRLAKWPISHSDMAHFACRYGAFRPLIWPFSGCEKGSFANRPPVSGSAVCAKRAF